MIAAGFIPYPKDSGITTAILFGLTCLTGWFSGMGWPPCGRVMSQWFSTNERSFKMSVWNTAHNIGSSGLAWLATIGGGSLIIALGYGADDAWREAFIIPSIAALAVAIICWIFIRDTPESCGLPSIEKYRNDFSGAKAKKGEENKIPFKTLFVEYIFKNKWIWMIAIANAFVYMVRYGVGDWAPIYLQEMDIMTSKESNLAFALHNYAGIPGTIICGWISSKFFKGRCAPPNIIFMGAVLLGTLIYWQAGNMAGFLASDPATVVSITKTFVYFGLILIGFCIYGPVALVTVQALNLVPKNAVGTAAGFVGLSGYAFGSAVLANILMGFVAEHAGWNMTFVFLSAASVIAMLLCAMTLPSEKKEQVEK
jgi:OPA family glycerol-3-phosphate transporter-like MFS transporter